MQYNTSLSRIILNINILIDVYFPIKNRILFLLSKYKKTNIKELLNEKKLVKLAYFNNIIAIIDLLSRCILELERD